MRYVVIINNKKKVLKLTEVFFKDYLAGHEVAMDHFLKDELMS
jgi:hypothetical protein